MSDPDRAAFEAWINEWYDRSPMITPISHRVWRAATQSERQRCIAAVDEASSSFGTTGAVVAAAIKAKIGEP